MVVSLDTMPIDGRVVDSPMVLATSNCCDDGAKDDNVVDGSMADGELLLTSNCSDDGAIDDSVEDGSIEVGNSLREADGALESTMLVVGSLDACSSIGLGVISVTPLGLPRLNSMALDGSNVDAKSLGEVVGTIV